MTQKMVPYYAERAAEYDHIYDIPPWRHAFKTLQQRVPLFFAGRRIYEVACGTGYWTQYIARHASRVYATDINDTTLAIAHSRSYEQAAVTFQQADAYSPPDVSETFDAGFAGFWLSHVDMGRIHDFLRAFHQRLERGARVLLFDERLSPRRRLPTSRIDAFGNRYEKRQLANSVTLGMSFTAEKIFETIAWVTRRQPGGASRFFIGVSFHQPHADLFG